MRIMQITPLLLLSLFGSSYCAVLSLAARDEATTSLSSSSAVCGLPGSALSTVYILPDGHYAENLAVRSNGKVLVTVIGAPEIWQIDPATLTGELLFTFPGGPQELYGNCTLGITEYAPDIFAIAGGKFDIPSISGVKKSWSIFSLDLTDEDDLGIDLISHISPAVFLNGMTSLPPDKNGNFLLVSDSYLGIIYRVDIEQGTWTIFLDDPALKRNTSVRPQLGVNGIRFLDNYLYFDNPSQAPMFARVPVSGDLTANGPVEVIATAATFPVRAPYHGYDDFAFDGNGDAWLATNPSRSIVKIDSDGGQVVEFGGLNDTTLRGCTSVQFGRGSNSTILYATVNAKGGKLLMVDTGLCNMLVD